MFKISTKQAATEIKRVLNARRVPFLGSPPGVGKSAICAQIAKSNGFKMIDIRLSQYDPTDLHGFPTLDVALGRSKYLPPITFPLDSDPVPEGFKGWLLFLDEITSAAPSVQMAAYQLVLDRMIGEHHLNKNVHIITAGNRVQDRAIANRLSTAMQSRLIHFDLEVTAPDWLEWANLNNIDYRINAFISFRPKYVHMFDPTHDDATFPCPRTWEFLSDIIKKDVTLTNKDLPIIAGTVGKAAATEFIAYLKVFKNVPTMDQIIADPKTVTIPTEPSTLYAVSYMISTLCSVKTIDKCMQVVHRLPKEFQMITMINLGTRLPELLENAATEKWLSENQHTLM